MTEEQVKLWKRIETFELDEDESALTFTDRLASENGWKYEFTARVIEEYKKFIFLICISKNSLTPSDAVDQVWHLHLIYTYSYWKDLCARILEREIHHGPTKGGSNESLKYKNLYSETLKFYKATFDQDPPSDIWPDPLIRFEDSRFQRVDLNKYWIIKKPSL